jgi:hypothetical protein
MPQRTGRWQRLLTDAIVLVMLTTSGIANGQTAPREDSTEKAPPDIAVMPPRLRGTAEVPYPKGARGDAVVLLTLTVGADGVVLDARAEAGAEPFASAAILEAPNWRFDPATRNGQAIGARIRFEVVFHEPARAISAAPPPPPSTSPGSAPINDSDEVTVRGERAAPGGTSIQRTEVTQLPGAFGDPFRAIDALPGVTPIVSGLPFFYVRGAPPGNVGYSLDGVKVPYLFHVGAGPSVIHPAMVERVDLYPGGAPARYGRFAGGIVAAETTTPRTDAHGEGNVRLFDLGALVETGFADGRGIALVGGRYSYTAAILSLIAKDTQLDYRDYQARVSYDVTSNDRVSLVTFGSYDLVAQTQNDIRNVLFASEFYRADARYDHRFGDKTTLRTAVTLGFDQTRIPDQPRNSRSTLAAARLELSHAVSERVLFRAGADATLEALRADTRPYSDPDDPDTQRFNALFPPRDDVTLGAWADVVLKLRGWEVIPGARVDLYRSGDASAVGVDPRVASRLAVAKHVHVIHAFGIAHQPPSFLIPIPGLAVGQLQGGLQTSIQSSAGVEVDLPEATTATVTLFDNVFQNMSDTLGVSQQRGVDNNFKEPRSLGSAIGAEVYVRRKLTRRFGGYLSYTLSRSTRSVGSELQAEQSLSALRPRARRLRGEPREQRGPDVRLAHRGRGASSRRGRRIRVAPLRPLRERRRKRRRHRHARRASPGPARAGARRRRVRSRDVRSRRSGGDSSRPANHDRDVRRLRLPRASPHAPALSRHRIVHRHRPRPPPRLTLLFEHLVNGRVVRRRFPTPTCARRAGHLDFELPREFLERLVHARARIRHRHDRHRAMQFDREERGRHFEHASIGRARAVGRGRRHLPAPAAPSTAHRWSPRRLGRGRAAVTNGLRRVSGDRDEQDGVPLGHRRELIEEIVRHAVGPRVVVDG